MNQQDTDKTSFISQGRCDIKKFIDITRTDKQVVIEDMEGAQREGTVYILNIQDRNQLQPLSIMNRN